MYANLFSFYRNGMNQVCLKLNKQHRRLCNGLFLETLTINDKTIDRAIKVEISNRIKF